MFNYHKQSKQLHFENPVQQRLVYNNPQTIHGYQFTKNPQVIVPNQYSLPKGSSPIKIGIDQNQVY